MTARFRESFKQDLTQISNKEMFEQLYQIIAEVEQSSELTEVSNLIKLSEGDSYYKIKLDEHRIALTVDKEGVTFVRCLHRNDISDFFLSRPK